MPQTQVANVQNFELREPNADGASLIFKVKRSGKLTVRVENPEGDVPVDITAKVSPDGTHANAVDTTVADNLVAVVNEAVPVKQNATFEILLRAGVDNYLHFYVPRAYRAQVQLRSSGVLLDPIQI